MRTTKAIVRRPATSCADGLTTANLGRPDHTSLCHQHGAYVRELEALGLEVEVLEPLSEFPDAHFIEDAAVVLPEVAVVTRPGAAARRGEAAAVEPVLRCSHPVERITEPGTLDGGDVLLLGRKLFVGLSERTDEEGAAQLGKIVGAHGYTSVSVDVGAGLHLKSSVNHLGDGCVLTTAALADHRAFAEYERIVVPVDEEYAANSLWINGTILTPSGFPATKRMLEELGCAVVELELSEARKMDGGLTCLSLRW